MDERKAFKMTNVLTKSITLTLLLTISTLAADENATGDRAQEQAGAKYQIMLEEAERARKEAVVARREATVAATAAREVARELSRESARQGSEQLKQERAVHEKGMAQAREELSRAHRELREASREIARAHRDLSRSVEEIDINVEIHTGDRAVIGVVLGRESDGGVEIIGVSPDGPAERAGLQQGDVLTSIRGIELGNNNEGRQSVFQVMKEVGDGEELDVVIARGGQTIEYVVVAEHREPRSLQSVIRIPDVQVVADVNQPRHVIIERIEVPDINEEELAVQLAELSERLEATNYMFISKDGTDTRHIEIEEFSTFGENAMNEASLWFGLPHAHGLQLATINEGLGSYFKTDRGVLVLTARDDNSYQLLPGDVILSIASTPVNSPSDMMRTLRDIDAGAEIEIEIKRDRRDKTLIVVMPENRLGLR
jgi:C-terminal processing protease CtpA/Prc